MLRAPVEFGASRNAIAFPSEVLNAVPVGSDQLLFAHLEKEAEEQLRHRAKDFLARFRGMLHTGLLDRDLSAHEIAARLGVHERTLNRKLHQRGTTFRLELETARFEAARRLLSDPDRSLSEVALSLNYADSSSFCRAFKRWSGQSPREWRQLQSR